MSRVTVAHAAGAACADGEISVGDARCPLDRKRFALLLVGIAAILTLGHLLGPQSDAHATSSYDHEAGHEHGDAPSHDHGAHACGLAVLPDADGHAPADSPTDPVADCVEPASPLGIVVEPRDRSPTDPVSELQVNRV
ncbi:hypothetical protein AB0K52_24005 [Glycomyces sp. NPDC049804]|uniref:hypothetical protein n=1 Tax=Glycomyces sp. NPDC049804 TaxID=3154363 RepID=UPI0034499A93